jgi:ABC-type glycerol-3-phosphate transport system substrate-binding protein
MGEKHTNQKLTRRHFLRLSAGLALGAVGAACAPAAAPQVVKETVVVEKIVEKEVPAVEPKPAGPVTVKLWGWWQPRMDLYGVAGQRFSDANPEVKVEVESMPMGTLFEKVLPATAAGTGPSILKTKPTYHFNFLMHGLLEPYPQEMFPDSWWEENFPDSWEAYRYEGENYVFVVTPSPYMLIYNRAMMEEAGLGTDPPETWDDLIEVGKKVTQYDSSGKITVAGLMANQYHWPHFTYQLGGNVLEVQADGTRASTMLSPESVQAFEFYTDLYTEHKIIPSEFLSAGEAIGTRKAVMYDYESCAYGSLTRNFPDVYEELGWTHSPTPTGSPPYGLKVNYIGLTVFATRPSSEKEAAFEYIRYLLNECDDVLADIAELLGSLPGKVSARAFPKFEEVDALRTAGELVLEMKDPVALLGTESGRIFSNARDQVVMQGMPVQAALEQAHEEWDAALKEGELRFSV